MTYDNPPINKDGAIATQLDDLKPDPNNARQHNARNIGMIRESLKEAGTGRSILVDGDLQIIAGHGVVEAAKGVGIKEVVVVEATGDQIIAVKRTNLTKAQAQRLALFDNRTAEVAEWDADVLATLRDQDAALLDGLWDEKELRELLPDDPVTDEGPDAQIDRAEELREKWGVERGQIWQVGRHRVMCGDATVNADVTRLMGGVKGQMLFTDPPYGVHYMDQRVSSGRFVKDKRAAIAGDEADAGELYYESLVVLLPHLDDKAGLYIWFAASHSLTTYKALARAGIRPKALLIWHKVNTGFGNLNHHYKQKHEPCIYGSKVDQAERWYGSNNEVTVWDIPKHGPNDLHPTMKPVELPLRALANSSKKADAVVDVFIGSGTTAVAAEQLGRTCYGMEIEPAYVAVTLERLADMGLKPEVVKAKAVTDGP